MRVEQSGVPCFSRAASFRLRPVDIEWLHAEARKSGVTASDVLRRVLELAREGKVDDDEKED